MIKMISINRSTPKDLRIAYKGKKVLDKSGDWMIARSIARILNRDYNESTNPRAVGMYLYRYKDALEIETTSGKNGGQTRRYRVINNV